MAEKQTGSVKWFDDSYGFDFIAPNDCSEDRSIRVPVIDQFGWIQESGRGRDSLGLKVGGLEGQRLCPGQHGATGCWERKIITAI
ncbi:unnamed protein product [Rhodiola kirilowii]